jgi:pimeloyl-ACP methyl ester carboxylesterase
MRAIDFELQEMTLHGHRVAYRMAGEGPPIILIHGITSSSANWRRVAPLLARHHTLIAPDLIGHGQSAKPRGDYSMGAFASGIRDLAVALGIGPATVVGHSLGGGVAMQFSYQFPERTDRLALVSSGGLGRQVHPLLRAATLPGSELILPLLAANGIRAGSIALGRAFRKVGIKLGTDTVEIARGHASLSDAESREAFVQALRASVDPGGQRVSATDRLYLAAQLPLLIVWGRCDRVIPVEHGERAHELVPGSRLHVFERAGHFPHLDEPKEFARLLEQWIRSTPAGHSDETRFRQAMLAGAA